MRRTTTTTTTTTTTPPTLSVLRNALLIFLLSAITTSVHGQENRLIYTFEYEFFPASIYDPPSERDIKQLVCMHDRYMTRLFRENSRNQAISYQASNIDWTFDELEVDIGIPLTVTFASDVTTDDGSAIPSPEAMALYSFDFLTFVTSYLYNSNNEYWRSVSGMYSNYDIGVRTGGALENGDCNNGGGVSRPPRGEETEAPPTLAPTTSPPTIAPTVTPEIQIIIAAVEYSFLTGKSRTPTPEELDNLICITNNFFAKHVQTSIGDPSATVQGTILQHFLNADESLWVLIALDISNQSTQEVNPTVFADEINRFRNAEIVDYIQNYVWQTFDGSVFKDTTSTQFQASVSDDPQLADLPPTCGSTGTEQQDETTPEPEAPAEEETPAPTAAAPAETPAPTAASSAEETQFSFATPAPTVASTTIPSTPAPTVDGETKPPTSAPTTAAGETSAPTLSLPPGETLAPTVQRTTPAEEGTTQPPTVGETEQQQQQGDDDESENPVGGGDDDDDSNKVVVFTLQYDFEEGTVDRPPTEAEIINLLCRTDNFFMDFMIESTGDETIFTYNSLINDSLVENDEQIYPFAMTFVSNTIYTTNGEAVDPNVIKDVMDLNADNILRYVGDYAMETTTPDDIFSNTIAVNFTSQIIDPELLDVPETPQVCVEEIEDNESTPEPTTEEPREETSSPVEAVGPVFVLEFGLSDDVDLRSPTESEVEDLMCQTDRFFQERMQTRLGDPTIESYGIFINWEFNSDDNEAQPISVTFLSNSLWGSGDPIPAALTVGMMMDLTEEEILEFIEDYVLATPEDSIFQGTTSVNFNDYMEGGPTLGDLARGTTTCTMTTDVNPTAAPTASPSQITEDDATTPNPTPADAGEPSDGETETPQPTTAPVSNPDDDDGSTTPQPTLTPDENGTDRPTARPTNGGAEDVQPTTPVPTNDATPPPSRPPTSGVTTAPVVAPPQESVAPAQEKRTGTYTVPAKFLISNLDGLKDPQTVRFSSGLDVAWSAFATEMVANVTKHWRAMGNRRRLVVETQQQHDNRVSLRRGRSLKDNRLLSIDRASNSAKVNAITERQCGPTDHLEATCLVVEAEYGYDIVNENYYFLNELFLSETQQALTNGTFQYILNRESPGTPLVIGNIPRDAAREYALSDGDNDGGSGSGKDGGLKGWAVFLIILLVLLLLAVPVILYFMTKAAGEKTPLLPPYEEENFVYDFFLPKGTKLQTEVDDYEARRKSMTIGHETPPQDSPTSSTADNDNSPDHRPDYIPVGFSGEPVQQDDFTSSSEDDFDEGPVEVQEERAIPSNQNDYPIPVPIGRQDDKYEDEWETTDDEWEEEELEEDLEGPDQRQWDGGSDEWEEKTVEEDLVEPHEKPDQSNHQRRQSHDPSGRHDLGDPSGRHSLGSSSGLLGSSSGEAVGDNRRRRYEEDLSGASESWENEAGEEASRSQEEWNRKRRQSHDPSGRHDLGSSSRQAGGEHQRSRFQDDQDEDGWENEGGEENHSDPNLFLPVDSTDDETQNTEDLMREHENNTLNLEHAENTNRMNQLGGSLPQVGQGAGVQKGGRQDPQHGDHATGAWTGYDDHLKGLVDIRSSHREEEISFGETGDDEDSLEDELVPRKQYRGVMENSQSSQGFFDSRHSQMSIESEGGWDDTSGASSRTSSKSDEEVLLWD